MPGEALYVLFGLWVVAVLVVLRPGRRVLARLRQQAQERWGRATEVI